MGEWRGGWVCEGWSEWVNGEVGGFVRVGVSG